MIAGVIILGEAVPDRFVWFMIITLVALALETRAWLRPKDKEDENR